MFFKSNATSSGENVSLAQFEQMVDSNVVTKAVIILGPSSNPSLIMGDVAGKYLKTAPDGTQIELPFKAKIPLYPSLQDRLFKSRKFEVKEANTVLLGLLYSFFPFLVIV